MSAATDKEYIKAKGLLGFVSTDLTQFKVLAISMSSIIIPKLINSGDRSLDNQLISLTQLVLGLGSMVLFYIYRLGVVAFIREMKYSFFYFSLSDTVKFVLTVIAPTYFVHGYVASSISSILSESSILSTLPAVMSNLCATCAGWVLTFLVACVSFSIWSSQANVVYLFDVDNGDILFQYISHRVFNKHIVEAQFKQCLVINDPQEIDGLFKYINRHVLNNIYCKTDTITREFRISQAHPDSQHFDFHKGFVDSIQNKRINFQLLPLFRYGRYVEDCVFASSMIATNDVKLYCDSEEGLAKFVKFIAQKYHNEEDNLGASFKDIQASEYYAGKVCRIFKADRQGTTGSGVLKILPADVNNIINPRATFDSLYYPEKDQLLTVLKKFKNRQLYTGGLSHMPNNLGIIFYGLPGCGKTGTTNAIANYLGRDIHEINLRRCKNRNELESVLQTVEYSKKIVVFEEFDCMAGILKTRKQLEDQSKSMENVENAALTQALLKGDDVAAIQRKMKDDRDRQEQMIDLGWFLTWFDGACKHEDKIVIATTNHVENLDPALLRSGRLGHKIYLTYCTRQMVIQIISRAIGEHLTDEEKQMLENHTVPENKWSPRDLIEMIVNYYDNTNPQKNLAYLLHRLDIDTPYTSL
jgi:hypothetical protein